MTIEELIEKLQKDIASYSKHSGVCSDDIDTLCQVVKDSIWSAFHAPAPKAGA